MSSLKLKVQVKATFRNCGEVHCARYNATPHQKVCDVCSERDWTIVRLQNLLDDCIERGATMIVLDMQQTVDIQ